ncbi:MAG: hypothetical protein ACQER7_11615 [Bacteroidota bacterium]
MDKTSLIKSAEKLNPVSSSSITAYEQQAEKIIGTMNERMLQRSDIKTLTGIENIDMMKDNHANHVQFMASIFKNKNAGVLVETILWVFRAYRSHGFSPDYWDVQLEVWKDVLKNILSGGAWQEIEPYYEWMQHNVPVFLELTNDVTSPKKS